MSFMLFLGIVFVITLLILYFTNPKKRVIPFKLSERYVWCSRKHSDPLFVNPGTKEYYFFDETWGFTYGPYKSKIECKKALEEYNKQL